ncbi:Small RNA 2'-O-methyltransferase [Psilocybe cubensis]|uniref:Small RNA 2'-O-methyltransferase n=2 Tax=Psilocybe cubensis TaxID=181762 RepID=A0A8H8CLQ6_PSICU|nr:Small RNA 2'-O-methyltransferase [Psilocybe cubensis]KAH9481250.1 Small RNA 2'-O-methyltransferase [Psilocybe cubensis]
MDMIHESDNAQELNVKFYPELFLQRRIWILDILRRENITRVLDVGCGEGQILGVLCQPAPWLTPPPSSILPPIKPSTSPDDIVPPSPIYNDDEVPTLHIREVHGLDISAEDLTFAVAAITPPQEEDEPAEGLGFRPFYRGVQRWEELLAKVWKGGLEVINEEFIDIECIVSTEVIEHLPEPIFSAFTPMLLGVYHPKFLLVTTPSYTFNARFTPPDAPRSARKGYPDPTGRTDRIFRHDDHKFEWTRDEFETWCNETAKEWGYDVEWSSIGRPLEYDPWGRDEELQGASFVATFRRRNDVDNEEREKKGRAKLGDLALNQEPHEALAIYNHVTSSVAKKPKPLSDIAALVKGKMEEFREAFMRVEEMWFEPSISRACGGWIELLVRAVEESSDLNMKRDVDGVVMKQSSMWSIELIGAVAFPTNPWTDTANTSVDYIPLDWTPGEGPHDSWDDSDAEGSTGIEGDVSAFTSDNDADEESDNETTTGIERSAWKELSDIQAKTRSQNNWASSGSDWAASDTSGWGEHDRDDTDIGWGNPAASSSSTAGWDGDESGDTTSY